MRDEGLFNRCDLGMCFIRAVAGCADLGYGQPVFLPELKAGFAFQVNGHLIWQHFTEPTAAATTPRGTLARWAALRAIETHAHCGV